MKGGGVGDCIRDWDNILYNLKELGTERYRMKRSGGVVDGKGSERKGEAPFLLPCVTGVWRWTCQTWSWTVISVAPEVGVVYRGVGYRETFGRT
jgi:hypothetical protein